MKSMNLKLVALLVAVTPALLMGGCAGYDALSARLDKVEASNASLSRDVSKIKGHKAKHHKKKHEMGVK